MVGFNRRFSPLLGTMRTQFAQPGIGSVSRYLVNAGQLESGSWYRDAELEGSRFAGEGGHFIDTLSWWTGSVPEEVFAAGGLEADELQATVRFADGSSGLITYSTTGNVRYPKETLDSSGGGRTARLDNFRQASVWTGRRRATTKSRGGQDKGQRHQLAQFVDACRTGAPMPISLESLLATTKATIAVGESWRAARRSAYDHVPVSPAVVCPPGSQDGACRDGVACARSGSQGRLGAPAGDQGPAHGGRTGAGAAPQIPRCTPSEHRSEGTGAGGKGPSGRG
jgi:predicted dehydrogenase